MAAAAADKTGREESFVLGGQAEKRAPDLPATFSTAAKFYYFNPCFVSRGK